MRLGLTIDRWAMDPTAGGTATISVATGPRPFRVANSDATGEPLVSNGQLGADIIHLAAGSAFTPHTHRGDHLLIVIAGEGTVIYEGQIQRTRAGDIFLIEGEVPHAVGAITDHVIIAVGSPHTPIDSLDRMALVAYESMTTDIRDLHCLICDLHALYPRRIHELGCPHCPCEVCHPVPSDPGIRLTGSRP